MILSLRELVVWTGLGPLEAGVHCIALCVSTVLATLLVELSALSWRVVFLPLYVAAGITFYYDAILYIRMMAFTWKTSTRSRVVSKCLRGPTVSLAVLNLSLLALLLSTEATLAGFLDNTNSSTPFVVCVALLLGLCLIRGFLLFRTLKRVDY